MIQKTLRRLRTGWRFNALIISILALGVGVNTALFSAVEKVLFRPLPYPEAERLVRISPNTQINKLMGQTLDDVLEIAAATAYVGNRFPISRGDGRPALFSGAQVLPHHFDVLQAHPHMGRLFQPSDSEPGAEPVMVVSYAFWRNQMAASPNVVGRSFDIRGEPHTVIGVLREDFRPLDTRWEVWLPLALDPANVQDLTGSYYLEAVGRLKNGVTEEQAERAIHHAWTELSEVYPQQITPERVDKASRILSLHESLVGETRGPLLTVQTAALVVLLIVCGNLIILLLARSLQQLREFAIRSAMGARSRDLLSVVVQDVLLLGLIGGLGGLLVAYLVLQGIRVQLPESLGWLNAEDLLGWRSLAFLFGTSLLSALVAAIGPSLKLIRDRNLVGYLASGTRGSGAHRGGERARKALVVVQVAAATSLLFVSFTVFQSLWRLTNVDSKLAENTLAVRVDLPTTLYPDPVRQTQFFQEALRRIEALPNVTQAGGIQLAPLTEGNWSFPYVAEDHPIPVGVGSVELPTANFRVVTPGYFDVAGLRILDGRDVESTDLASDSGVALINQVMADELWPDQRAVGKEIRLFGTEGPQLRVIGVAESVPQHKLTETPLPEIYQPMTQWTVSSLYLLARGQGTETASFARTVRNQVWGVDPEVSIAEPMTLGQIVSQSVADRRQVGLLLIGFAFIALSLSLSGLYGMMSHTVDERTREIGIRLALGSDRRQILRLMVGQAARLIFPGLFAGFVLSWWTTSLPQLEAIGWKANYLVILPGVLVLIGVAAFASIFLPAWRAARIAPTDALQRT